MKSFPDDAPGSIGMYIAGRVSLFRKRFKSVAFGPPLVRSERYKVYGPLMEARNSDRGCLQSEGQRDLVARSFLEIVRFLRQTCKKINTIILIFFLEFHTLAYDAR